jgi:hypothetical protein
LIGLTGLLAAVVGTAILYIEGLSQWERIIDALHGNLGRRSEIAAMLLCFGALAAALALFVECYQVVFATAARRSASSLVSLVQFVLVVGLVVGANLFSSRFYKRFDWTRDREFTVPERLQSELRDLKGETTVVVYLPHTMFGTLTDKSEARSQQYESAAERKIVEKIKDLVEEFRALGPQFKIVMLDVVDDDFDDELARATENRPELRKAINRTHENSIFFSATEGDKEEVQQLSFNDFYLLDKTASVEANNGRGNLVLIPQGDSRGEEQQYTHGAERFAKKVFKVDERKPRVLIAVVHPALTADGSVKRFSAAEAKKALVAAGFEVDDIVLSKTDERGRFTGEGIAYTDEDVRYEQLERKQVRLNEALQSRRKNETLVKDLQTLSLQDLTDKYSNRFRVRQFSETFRKLLLVGFRRILARIDDEETILAKIKKNDDELKRLNPDSLEEKRRLPNLKAQMERTLQNYDLLVIPRMTLVDASEELLINNRIHDIRPEQVEAIRDFLKAGKSALVCFGPPLSQTPPPPGMPGPTEMRTDTDDLEKIFADLGLDLSTQTLLYDLERDSIGPRRGQDSLTGHVEVPSVRFEPGDGSPSLDATTDAVRQSIVQIARSLGKDESLAVRVRHPREIEPNTFKLPKGAQATTFIWTDAETTKEKDPLNPPDLIQIDAALEELEQYERGQVFVASALASGTIGGGQLPQMLACIGVASSGAEDLIPAVERKSFSIGVALERTLPKGWYKDDTENPKQVRIAAIGNGHLFTDEELTPAKSKLLVDTCNWLVGRDDYLARNNGMHWQYPRMQMTDTVRQLWTWGLVGGLPMLFAYAGLVVLLLRRVR